MMTYISDGLMVCLLIMAIVFCWKLNARLKKLREMGEDLSPFMKNLAIYLNNISTTIDKLKSIADLSDRGLNENIPTAKMLKDDFDILLEHSEKVAQRLDEVIEKARQMDHQLHHTLKSAEAFQRIDNNICDNNQVMNDRQKYRSTVHPQFGNNTIRSEIEIEAYTKQQALDSQYEEGEYFHSHEDQFIATQQKTKSSAIPPTERGIMEKLKGIR